MISYYDFKRNCLFTELAQGDFTVLPKAISLLELDLTNRLLPIKEPKDLVELFRNVLYEEINTGLKKSIKEYSFEQTNSLKSLIEQHKINTQLLFEEEVDLTRILTSIEKDFNSFIDDVRAMKSDIIVNQIKTGIESFISSMGGGSPSTGPSPSPGGSPIVGHGRFHTDIEPDEMGMPSPSPSASPTSSSPASPTAAGAAPAAGASGGWWNKVKPYLNGLGNMFVKYPMHKLKKMYQGAKDIWHGKFEHSIEEEMVLIEGDLTTLMVDIEKLINGFKEILIDKIKDHKNHIIKNVKVLAASGAAATPAAHTPIPASPASSPTAPAPTTTTATTTTATTPPVPASPAGAAPLGPDLATTSRLGGKPLRNTTPEATEAGKGKRSAAAWKIIRFLLEMSDYDYKRYSDKIFQSGGINLSLQYASLMKKFRTDPTYKEFRKEAQETLDKISKTHPDYIASAEKDYPTFKSELMAKIKGFTPPEAGRPPEMQAKPEVEKAPEVKEPEAKVEKPPVKLEPMDRPKPLDNPKPLAQPLDGFKGTLGGPEPKPEVPPELATKGRLEPKSVEQKPEVPKTIEKPVAEPDVKPKPLDEPMGDDNDSSIIKKIIENGDDQLRKLIFNKVVSTVNMRNLDVVAQDDRKGAFATALVDALGIHSSSEIAEKIREKIEESPLIDDFLKTDPLPMRSRIAQELSTPIYEILADLVA